MRQIRANATRPSTVVANAPFSLRTLRQTSFFPRSLDIALRFAGSSPVPSFGSLLSRNSFPCFPLFGSPVVLTGWCACEVSYWKNRPRINGSDQPKSFCRVAGGTGRRVGFFNYSFVRVFLLLSFFGEDRGHLSHKKSKWESFFFWGWTVAPLPNVHPKCNRPTLLLYNAKKYTFFLFWSSISSPFFFLSFQDLTLVNKINFKKLNIFINLWKKKVFTY
jgi:hypothetical protein